MSFRREAESEVLEYRSHVINKRGKRVMHPLSPALSREINREQGTPMEAKQDSGGVLGPDALG